MNEAKATSSIDDLISDLQECLQALDEEREALETKIKQLKSARDLIIQATSGADAVPPGRRTNGPKPRGRSSKAPPAAEEAPAPAFAGTTGNALRVEMALIGLGRSAEGGWVRMSEVVDHTQVAGHQVARLLRQLLDAGVVEHNGALARASRWRKVDDGAGSEAKPKARKATAKGPRRRTKAPEVEPEPEEDETAPEDEEQEAPADEPDEPDEDAEDAEEPEEQEGADPEPAPPPAAAAKKTLPLAPPDRRTVKIENIVDGDDKFFCKALNGVLRAKQCADQQEVANASIAGEGPQVERAKAAKQKFVGTCSRCKDGQKVAAILREAQA